MFEEGATDKGRSWQQQFLRVEITGSILNVFNEHKTVWQLLPTRGIVDSSSCGKFSSKFLKLKISWQF